MQQIQTTAWSESAVHAFADLGQRSCHYHHFIFQKRSKCLWFESAGNAFADLELLSCHYHYFICQKRSKCSRFKPQRGLNLLYMLSLILDSGAVTTIISSTKSAANACGLNLLYMLSLILNCWAVTTIILSAKIATNAADSNHSVVWICCTCFRWSWTAELSLPSFHLPKAQQMPVVGICCTCFRWSWTAELSLPSFHLPKAQQMPVVWICCTCFRWSWTAELSLPSFHLPKSRQMQQIQTTAWSESAVHAFADLGLRSCHYHHFIYQKRSKCLWFESAAHAFADLGLLSCHYHHFIYQKRSKCSRFKPQRGLNLLYMPRLILDCWAVTTIISSAKSAENAADSNHSVVWICCTCLGWSWTAELSLPSFHLPKAQKMQQIQTTAWSESAVHASLIWDCGAVTTNISSSKSAENAADSNHSVVWICCTCFRWSGTAELSLPTFHLPKAQKMQQIQTTAWSESAVHAFADLGLRSCHYHHFICHNRSKCSRFKPQRGLNLLYMPRLILDCWAVTTIISSAKSAENAADSNHSVVWICCTCLGWSWTAELLLPSFHLPKAQQMQQIQSTADH